MSGTASVPNQFAAAVTATGAQLDQNYSTLVAYINDPTNRNNYAADAGTTNTISLTFSPPVVGGYTSGLEITFKAAQTNSGPVVLNANGLGNVNLVAPDGSALSSAAITVGSTYKAVYDGTRFVGIGFAVLQPATQAQMQTATALGVYVSPAREQYHPSSAKAWGQWSGTATGVITPLASYGITSVTKAGAGSYSIVLSSAFASTAWVPIGICGSAGSRMLMVRSQNATSCVLTSVDVAGTASDADLYVYFTAYGTQA